MNDDTRSEPADETYAVMQLTDDEAMRVHHLAAMLLDQGKITDARTLWTGLCAQHPDVALFATCLGLACHKDGDRLAAAIAFDNGVLLATMTSPDLEASARLERAYFAVDTQQLAQAQEDVRAIGALTPGALSTTEQQRYDNLLRILTLPTAG